jgi:RNA polymerase sigma factor (sigma-70 family)
VSAILSLSSAPVVDFEVVIPVSSALQHPAGAETTVSPELWTVPQLTAGVRRGDENAVRALYARYCGRLTRYVLVITRGNETVAAEAVQSAFLKSLRHLRLMTCEDALWAWLARAARTAASDIARGSRRYTALLGRVAALFSREDEPPVEDTEAVWLAALEKAIAQLDDDSRALIEARYYQRRPLTQVAAEQSSTGRAIEGRLARVREKLRRSILQHLASDRHES